MVEGDRNNRSRSRSRVPLWNDSGRSCSRAPRPTSASSPEPGPSYNCYMNQASVVGCPCGLPGTQDWPTCVCWRFDHGGPSAERGVSSQHASSGGMQDIQALGRIPKEYKGTKDEAERAESRVAGHLRRLRDSLSETQKEELASLNERGVDSQQGASSKGSRIPTTPKRRPRNIYCSVGQLANDTPL